MAIHRFYIFIHLLVLQAVVCEQIYINEPVSVSDFVGSGLVGNIDGIGSQTMFEITEKDNYFLNKDINGNILLLSGTYDSKSVRKITPAGMVSTVALAKDIKVFASGYNNDFFFANERLNQILKTLNFQQFQLHKDKLNPSLSLIGGMCVDSAGSVYLSYTLDHKIYKINPDGLFELFAGSGNRGNLDGNGIFSSFGYPKHLAVDSLDNIYVNDSDNWSIRLIDKSRNVKTLTGQKLITIPPKLDGPKGTAEIRSVKGMSCDQKGNLVIACGESIRIVDRTGYIRTIAGDYYKSGYSNGSGTSSKFEGATDVVCIGNNIFVAEGKYPRIRKITIGVNFAKTPFNNVSIKLSAGITINGVVGKKYVIESSANNGKQWNQIAEVNITSSPYNWYDENSMGTNNLYRVFESP